VYSVNKYIVCLYFVSDPPPPIPPEPVLEPGELPMVSFVTTC